MTLLPLSSSLRWSEGMLLMPQHFQQQDILWQRRMGAYLAHINPCFWGVKELRLDEGLLLNGIIHLQRICAIFQDGTYIDHGPEDDVLRYELAKNPEWNQLSSGQSVTIYLTLRANAKATPLNNYTLERWDISDLNDTQEKITLDILVPKIEIVAHRTTPFPLSIPLVKIVKTDTKWQKDESYIPPLCHINPNESLGLQLFQLTKRVREKIIFLQSKLPSSNSAHHGVSDIENIRQRLIKGLLPFETVIKSRSTLHLIYVSLNSMAGDMAAIIPNQPLPLLEAYMHEDIAGSFAPCLHFIHSVLDWIDRFDDKKFFEYQKDRFVLQNLNTPSDAPKSHYIVGVDFTEDVPLNIQQKWCEDAVIADERSFENVRLSRLLGAPRRQANVQDKEHLFASPYTFIMEIDPHETLQNNQSMIIMPGLKDVGVRHIWLYAPQHPATARANSGH